MDSISDVTETDMDQSISVTFRVSEDSGMIERNISFEVSLALGGIGIVVTHMNGEIDKYFPLEFLVHQVSINFDQSIFSLHFLPFSTICCSTHL